ncbi:crotonase/enoyl-CoA hydratase family protein [Niveispirillum fermenti]|uniref:crotonase/enoyl-CoA hydratase family protein n=1 Tax=Niveispirillum fermenti TaxID=1233113 RepID=UPI003A879AD6
MIVFQDRVTLDIADGIADVRLARPEKLNALDRDMFTAIADAVAHLEGVTDLRAVVLSGQGRAFCAGIDTAALAETVGVPEQLTVPTHGPANLFQQATWGWHTLPVPVIAAIHGVAFGGGFQIMLGADIRVMTPDTRLSVMEVRWGLVPDMGGIARMQGLAGDDVIRDLTFTGREFTGADALTLGFATRLSGTPLDDAMDTARLIATRSPEAVRAAKRLLNAAADRDAADILYHEAREQTALLRSAQHAATLAAAKGPSRR